MIPIFRPRDTKVQACATVSAMEITRRHLVKMALSLSTAPWLLHFKVWLPHSQKWSRSRISKPWVSTTQAMAVWCESKRMRG